VKPQQKLQKDYRPVNQTLVEKGARMLGLIQEEKRSEVQSTPQILKELGLREITVKEYLQNLSQTDPDPEVRCGASLLLLVMEK
jgi:hypothetical protein